MNINISLIKNVVYTIFSNSLSKGKVQDFSYMLCIICIWEGTRVFMLSFRGLFQVS